MPLVPMLRPSPEQGDDGLPTSCCRVVDLFMILWQAIVLEEVALAELAGKTNEDNTNNINTETNKVKTLFLTKGTLVS